jgi:poly(3-hydroxybutyrate) depolymerase
MKLNQTALGFAALLTLLPAPAKPQALPNLGLARLNYTVRKRVVKPQGELKTQIDANDAQLAEATRTGNIGEVRRLIAKGQSLLNGKLWTDELDFGNSLVVRTETVFVDPAKPWTVRIEQIYTPSIKLEHNLSAHISIVKPPATRDATPEPVKDLGTFEEVSRDLRESPYLMDLDVSALADGSYQLQVEVLDGPKSLGSPTLRFVAQKGLTDSISRIEAGSKSASENIRAEALYPIGHMHTVNQGLMDIGQFDLAKELAAADRVLAASKGGKDPFAGQTGDFKRHYYLKSAKEIMPYRMYVPTNYTAAKAFPLVVALHGLGGTEDSMFGAAYKVSEQAAQRGYIAVAPLGYRIDGGYGRGDTRRAQLSEQDVMEVLAIVRKQYNIDNKRIYLVGHSMGGGGTWELGARYANIWAAIAPISGPANLPAVEKLRHMPVLAVHGDADTVVLVDASRSMVAALKKQDTEVKYIEVPGGSHGSVSAPNMSAIFDFFDAHTKAIAN